MSWKISLADLGKSGGGGVGFGHHGYVPTENDTPYDWIQENWL